MELIETFKEEYLEFAWWVEILTARPYCTYYFGPFKSAKEAVLVQDGYIEDLVNEEAQGIAIKIKWCKPRQATIFFEDELVDSSQMWDLSASKEPRILKS